MVSFFITGFIFKHTNLINIENNNWDKKKHDQKWTKNVFTEHMFTTEQQYVTTHSFAFISKQQKSIFVDQAWSAHAFNLDL